MLKFSLLACLLVCVKTATQQSNNVRNRYSQNGRSLALGKLEAPSDVVKYRINCGAGQFTDSTSDEWTKDEYFLNGSNAGGWFTWLLGGDSPLMDTYREQFRMWFFGGSTSLQYEIPVTAGNSYVVEMIFPQRFNWFGLLPPARQNIYFEGLLAFNEFRLDTVQVQSESVVVKDGSLTIKFESSTDSPAVGGIVVYEMPVEVKTLDTASPSSSPSEPPSASPSASPSGAPFASPIASPSASPTAAPAVGAKPTAVPSAWPSASPTGAPFVGEEPTAVPSASPSSAPSSAPMDNSTGTVENVSVAQINVGSYQFTDPEGNIWSDDTYSTAGGNYTVEDDIEIEGTNNDALYRSELNGNFQLSVPVPTGTYQITMHFAELYHETENARIFSILLEGDVVMKDVDLVANLGKRFVATQKTFVRTISDGSIDIAGTAKVDNAKLNGLDIVRVSDSGGNDDKDIDDPVPTGAPTDAPTDPQEPPVEGMKTIARINCGSYAFVDKNTGYKWSDDIYNEGGSNFTVPDDTSIANSNNDHLYFGERYGDFTYTIPVPETGRTYQIIMHFTELYHEGPGLRVFDVILEEETVIDDLDLFKTLGDRFIATKYSFERIISDGFIDIEVQTEVDNGKISGLEVYMLP